ncbi:phage tail assembly chaperone [bacterium]|nr:MAG: phage tail assembly chaperone [bacterium]
MGSDPEPIDYKGYMGVAAQCGILPANFWDMTPAELIIYAEATNEKEKDRFKQIITGAWLSAAYARAKKIPELNEVMRKLDRREMTDEELLEQIKALNAALGGEVIG